MAETTFNYVYKVTVKTHDGTVTEYSTGKNDRLNTDQTPAKVTEISSFTGDNLGELSGSSDTFNYGTDTYTYVGNVSGGFVAKIGNSYYLFTSSAVDTGSTKLTVGTAPTVICFLPGTQIATPAGEVSVEMLQRGDLVETADGRTIPVRWIGRQTVSMLFADPVRVLPICIKAGALAENVPSRDLYVSPDHAILIDDILVHASALVNGTSIVRALAPAQTFTYYHVELADHSLLLADNVPAESFIDNVDRLAFDNWDEHEGLGDETAPLVEMAYPRAKAARQVPVAMRERLAARAQALFGAVVTQAA
jgi:hypothetical protein